MTLLACALVGWLIGSIPTAYLVVKRRHGLDVHLEGSANVGANNAYRTTGSKRIGALVLALDALKGIAAAAAGWAVATALGASDPYWSKSAALLGAITGHNYNLWLSLSSGRLAGGKGLATAAGGFLLVTPLLVPVWAVLFLFGRWAIAALRGVRDTIFGNVVATALVPFAAWVLYGTAGFVVVLAFAALVLPKHVEQVRALWSKAET
jgi:glycerol-3-phosphate acyltransferase PlsY